MPNLEKSGGLEMMKSQGLLNSFSFFPEIRFPVTDLSLLLGVNLLRIYACFS